MNETDIRHEFARYNANVQEELALCFKRHGHLAPILQMFGQHAPTDIHLQAATIHQLLAHYGQVFFLIALKSGADRDSIRKMGKHITAVPDQKPTPAPAPPLTAPQASSTVQPRSPYARPTTTTDTAPIIDVPGYKGRDRRKATTRRSPDQPDRRGTVDLVYKNRRFGGGERRKQRRRATDRIDPSDKK